MYSCFFYPLEKMDGTIKKRQAIIANIRSALNSTQFKGKFLLEYCFDHSGYIIVLDGKINEEDEFYLALKGFLQPMPSSRFIY